MIPLLDSDSLQAALRQLKTDVEAICFPKGRRVGSAGHRKAREFLVGRLGQIGCEPYRGVSFELPYERGGQAFCNLAGVVPGRDRSLPPLLVGAHYDSAIDAPSADDNAAAVAIVLAGGLHAVVRGGSGGDLVVAIFDAEEPPYFRTPRMGSERFYHDQMDDRGVHAAVVLDLVGHDVSVHSSLAGHLPAVGKWLTSVPGLKDWDIPVPLVAPMVFVTGAESHPELRAVLKEAGVTDGLKVVSTRNQYVGDVSDHGVFRANGVPYFFLSCGLWAHYHSPTDTPDRLNYRKMERIARQTQDLLWGLDGSALQRGDGGARECETLAFEVESLREAFGPLWGLLLRQAGLAEVRSRKDMDRVVATLLGFLGI